MTDPNIWARAVKVLVRSDHLMLAHRVISEHTSAMISVDAPEDVQLQVAELGMFEGPGAVDPEELHCTMLYLGKIADLQDIEGLIEQIAAVAFDHEPFDISIGGFGAFIPGEDGTPYYASLDSKGFAPLRVDLEQAIEKLIPSKSEHGFVPHMTLGYATGAEDPFFPKIKEDPPKWKADSIFLHLGDEITEFSLGQGD
jgi:2'-5' RNA ligase